MKVWFIRYWLVLLSFPLFGWSLYILLKYGVVPFIPILALIMSIWVREIQMCREGRRKHREQHFEHLAAIASTVLRGSHNLIDTEENKTGRGIPYTIFYVGGSGGGVTREGLAEALERDIGETCDQYSQWEFDLLVSHVKAEVPEVASKGFAQVKKENPYQVIDTLRVLSHRKTFKGTCLVCQDWSSGSLC